MASSSHVTIVAEVERPQSGTEEERDDTTAIGSGTAQRAQLLALVNNSCDCPSQPSADLFGIGPTVDHRPTCRHFAHAAIARVTLTDRWSTFCARYGHPLDRPLDVTDRRDPNTLANYCAQLYSLINSLPNQDTTAAMLPLLCFIEEVAWTAHSYQARLDRIDSLAIFDVIEGSLQRVTGSNRLDTSMESRSESETRT
jgi:hypothetical protein